VKRDRSSACQLPNRDSSEGAPAATALPLLLLSLLFPRRAIAAQKSPLHRRHTSSPSAASTHNRSPCNHSSFILRQLVSKPSRMNIDFASPPCRDIHINTLLQHSSAPSTVASTPPRPEKSNQYRQSFAIVHLRSSASPHNLLLLPCPTP
jgi:uncharacterized protein (TIGR03382 family)